jgi:hypothetical protein
MLALKNGNKPLEVKKSPPPPPRANVDLITSLPCRAVESFGLRRGIHRSDLWLGCAAANGREDAFFHDLSSDFISTLEAGASAQQHHSQPTLNIKSQEHFFSTPPPPHPPVHFPSSLSKPQAIFPTAATTASRAQVPACTTPQQHPPDSLSSPPTP